MILPRAWSLHFHVPCHALLIGVACLLAGCAPIEGSAEALPLATPTAKAAPMPIQITAMPLNDRVSVTGWFITVWNGEPHYSVADDQGVTWRLDLDRELTRPLGGPLKLDRKRVTVVGELVSTSPRVLRAISIRLAAGP